MLIWLASYPRSGSALTQVILWQCFGISVATSVKSNADVTPALVRFRGPQRYPASLSIPEIANLARDESDPVVVKSHALPADKDPAIVVVRDGRPVMRSYARFKTEVLGRPTTIRELIEDKRDSWSRHVNAWLDHDAPKIVLRYEDLRVGDQNSIDAIGAFLGIQQTGQFSASVDSLREIRPTHIRDAGNEPGIEEIEQDHSEAFWSQHGEAMERLGYRKLSTGIASATGDSRAILSRR
jgi:hypothetical protein